MKQNDTLLSPSQGRAITALLSERSTRAAAKAVKVSEATLWRWLRDPTFKGELARRQSMLISEATRRLVGMQDMAIEALTDVFARADDHAKGDLGKFFKISKRWTDEPLPTDEILAKEEYTVKVRGGGTEGRTRYQVKKIVLDTKALVDPKRSRLIKKFADNPNNGMSIDLHDPQEAAVLKLRAAQTVLELMLKLCELNSFEERIRKLEEAYQA